VWWQFVTIEGHIMTTRFDLKAPIIPGKSAAGVQLGGNISKILAWAKPVTITPLTQGKCYYFGSVELWVNNESKVTQIGLHAGYQGKVANTIGIGSTLGEVAASVGPVIEDEEDNLVVQGLAGCCFETHQWQQQKNALPDFTAKINEIYVFSESGQRITPPKYPTVCPRCHAAMQFDLILNDGRGVNASQVQGMSPEEIAGYGYYCEHCGRGWTGDQLLQIVSEDKRP
jgi:hypothetical protein